MIPLMVEIAFPFFPSLAPSISYRALYDSCWQLVAAFYKENLFKHIYLKVKRNKKIEQKLLSPPLTTSSSYDV
jgi:hypothetical protein